MNTSTPRTPTPRLLDRLQNSSSFTFSLLLHVGLLALAGTIVLVTPKPEEFIPEGQVPSGVTVPEIDRPSDENDKPVETKFASAPQPETPPQLPQPKSQIIPITVKGPSPEIGFTDIPFPNLTGGGEQPINLPQRPPAGIAPDYGDRFLKGIGGEINMTGRPGKPVPPKGSEAAVMRGLRWLRDHQNKDGSWGDRNKGAMTGLALLCFLGHGETAESREFGYSVNNAIDWVMEQGTKHEGRLSMTKDNWGPGNAGVYEHAILTYALGEYFSMHKGWNDEKADRVVELLKQAVGYIVKGQSPDGGWMYNYDKTQGDTSVSGWQVQALKAAHLTGLNLPGVDNALDQAMKNLDRVQGPNGGYGYRNSEDRYSLTGVGVVCELFWKGARAKDLRRSVEFIKDKSDREFPVQYQGEKGDLYAWYYNTQAMLMYGGVAWSHWETKFSKEIIAAQSPAGDWPVMKAAGHGNLQSSNEITGQVYRTTLCILMLEVYYRYMPVHRSEIGESLPKVAVR